MEFPQFRKLTNGKSYYKIAGPTQFIELQNIGSKWLSYTYQLSQFPDLLRLNAMLNAEAPFEMAEEQEFLEIEKQTQL
jgi:hypothetical protein